MTSRERARKALNHQEPDRLPIGLGGNIFTGIHIDEYIEIARYQGLDPEPSKVYEQFQMLARFDETMRKRLHTDMIELEDPSMTWGYKNDNWKEWTTCKGNRVCMPSDFVPEIDEKGYIYINYAKGNHVAFMPLDGLYFERTCPTGMSENPVRIDPDEWKKSLPIYDDAELRMLEHKASELYEGTTYIQAFYHQLCIMAFPVCSGVELVRHYAC